MSKVEVAKLSALNKALTERNQGEELERLQVLLNVREGESVVLTRISPLDARSDTINIGKGLYWVKKPSDMKEQSVDVSSDDSKLGSLRSINVKLAEQLQQKKQEMEEVEMRHASELESAQRCKAEMESRVEELGKEIGEHKSGIQDLERERTSLSNQARITREALERYQSNNEGLQERIRFLEQELGPKSKTTMREDVKAVDYERCMSDKDGMIADLQGKIAELVGKQVGEGVNASQDAHGEEEMRLRQRIDELELELEAAMHHTNDGEDLRSQLGDAQTTIDAFKAEICRLKDQLDRSQSLNVEYLRTVFLRFLQKPECRGQSLELLKTLLQFTQEEQATFQIYFQ
jgi:chromosome segregation ATPase